LNNNKIFGFTLPFKYKKAAGLAAFGFLRKIFSPVKPDERFVG